LEKTVDHATEEILPVLGAALLKLLTPSTTDVKIIHVVSMLARVFVCLLLWARRFLQASLTVLAYAYIP